MWSQWRCLTLRWSSCHGAVNHRDHDYGSPSEKVKMCIESGRDQYPEEKYPVDFVGDVDLVLGWRGESPPKLLDL